MTAPTKAANVKKALANAEPSGRDFFNSNHVFNRRSSSTCARSVGPVGAAMFNAAISWQHVEFE
jgi:hypothetical protein